jgi:hypothetical protein
MIETIMTKFQGVSRWVSGGEVLEQNGQLLDARCVLAYQAGNATP